MGESNPVSQEEGQRFAHVYWLPQVKQADSTRQVSITKNWRFVGSTQRDEVFHDARYGERLSSYCRCAGIASSNCILHTGSSLRMVAHAQEDSFSSYSSQSQTHFCSLLIPCCNSTLREVKIFCIEMRAFFDRIRLEQCCYFSSLMKIRISWFTVLYRIIDYYWFPVLRCLPFILINPHSLFCCSHPHWFWIED